MFFLSLARLQFLVLKSSDSSLGQGSHLPARYCMYLGCFLLVLPGLLYQSAVETWEHLLTRIPVFSSLLSRVTLAPLLCSHRTGSGNLPTHLLLGSLWLPWLHSYAVGIIFTKDSASPWGLCYTLSVTSHPILQGQPLWNFQKAFPHLLSEVLLCSHVPHEILIQASFV